MAMTTSRSTSNPLKRRMEAPEFPPHRKPSPSSITFTRNGKPSPIPPAFAMGKGNQNEREMPPAYIMATSPVAIQSDFKGTKQLPLGLILLIIGSVGFAVSFFFGVVRTGCKRIGGRE
jgi:hypothetical protein